MAETEFLVELGRRVARRRKELHLTQEQTAEAMNVSLQTISCVELGKKAIRPENLVRLCEVLETTADYLLTGQSGEVRLTELENIVVSLGPEDYELVRRLAIRLHKNTKNER